MVTIISIFSRNDFMSIFLFYYFSFLEFVVLKKDDCWNYSFKQVIEEKVR
jgi:hypothetical protein